MHWNASKQRWVGRVVVDGRRVETGSYSCKDTAVKKRKDFIVENNLTDYMDTFKYD